jgi:fatty acid-binding protein DegV
MVRIVTDSTSDITQAEGRKLGITIVPLTVHFLGESYRDGIDLSNREFFAKLAVADSIPPTSQVPPGEFTHLFHSSSTRGTMSSASSSPRICPVHTSRRGGARAGGRRKNYVVDSRVATFELSLLVPWP